MPGPESIWPLALENALGLVHQHRAEMCRLCAVGGKAEEMPEAAENRGTNARVEPGWCSVMAAVGGESHRGVLARVWGKA